MAIVTQHQTGARGRAWEGKFGCWAALSLTILEIKRLLLLALEMLVDSRAIRFAGALVPFVFSFVDVGLGLPVALAALLAMRKNQTRACYPNNKRSLRRIASILSICFILNLVSLILIAYQLNLDVDSLSDAFAATMKFYRRNASCKLIVDELQLDLQCCGYTSYADWFAFDWQAMDHYEDKDDRSVPYSCCNKHAAMPCQHASITDDQQDARTLSNVGCAVALARILFKIALVGYTMTGLVVCTQLLLIFYLIRIIRKVMPDICPSDCSCWEASCPIMTGPIINSSSDEYSARCHQTYRHPNHHTTCRSPTKPRKVCRRPKVARQFCASTSSKCTSPRSVCTTSCSSDSSSSSYTRLTSSPSFVPKRSDKASNTPNQQPKLAK